MGIEWKGMVRKLSAIALLGIVLLPAARSSAEESPAFKDQKEKISYGIGVGVARDFERRGVELDVDTFMKGLRDELSGSKLLMNENELDSTMHAYEHELRLKQQEREKAAAAENKKTGEAFLSENAKKEGVITLPSGLQYKVLKAGNGDKPTDADSVLINYRGTLIDGKEFDSSYRAGQPAAFTVIGVLPGLREALKLMNTGSRWQIFIPSQLGYGERRVYEVGPNSTLIFDVEIVSLKKSAPSGETDEGKTSAGTEAQPSPEGKKSPAGTSPDTGAAH
ncbi:MAG TPA: FKBP-type peptidyl-prolyl cis-trans isomerase [Nitrospirota bacterium]|nr:FKBP-type peptidyl-prolyl cis-trans isomerase [Nitrospirota bacterium]